MGKGILGLGVLNIEPTKLEYKMAKAEYLFTHKPRSQILKWMSPKEFLSLVPPTRYSKETTQELKEKIRKGTPLDPLFLDIDIDSCNVMQHEGRHRAKAAIELDIKKIPVILYHKERYNGQSGFIDIKGKEQCKILLPEH
ncbi:MAG: hypothetical protein ABIC57_00165 [bacterium]